MSTGKSTSNITAKVIGVVFAAVLWFVVTTNDTFTYEIELPVRYAGPTEGLMVTGNRPDHVMVTIQGTGKSLVGFSASRLFRTGQQYAFVNLSELSRGDHTITLEPGDINLADDSDINVTDIAYSDDSVNSGADGFAIFIDREISRTLPVRADSLGDYSFERGIVSLGGPVPDPAEVIVTGAQESVEPLRFIRPEPLEGRRIILADSVISVDLATPEYASADPSEVHLRFRLDTLATRRLRIPVRLRNFPRNNELRPIPDSLNADIQGAASVVSALDPETLRAEITYESYRDQTAGGDSLVTPSAVLPDGILEIRFRPGNVRMTAGS